MSALPQPKVRVPKESKQKRILTALFEKCRVRGDMVFNNEEVRAEANRVDFKNPHQATKIDNLRGLPNVMRECGYFPVHLGNGRHMFVRDDFTSGKSVMLHWFERIPPECVFTRAYSPSVLNEINTSESNILSVGVNQRIFHDFLYGNAGAAPNVYNSHRTQHSVSYAVRDARVRTDNLQMELDLTFELNGRVTVFEGKNSFPSNFAVYQLFHPHLYYSALKKGGLEIRQVDCCYFLRRKRGGVSVVRLYLYEFERDNPASIRLVKCAEYRLVRK